MSNNVEDVMSRVGYEWNSDTTAVSLFVLGDGKEPERERQFFGVAKESKIEHFTLGYIVPLGPHGEA